MKDTVKAAEHDFHHGAGDPASVGWNKDKTDMAPYVRIHIPFQYRQSLPEPKYSKTICGFCAVGSHDHCKRAFRNGNGAVALCPCAEPFHPQAAAQQVKCLECNNDDIDELDEKLWLCIDVPDCERRVNKRIREHPDMQPIIDAYVSAGIRTREEAKSKPQRVSRNPSRPSTGRCLCCDEPTRGGLFLPGHDARLVSMKAKEVENGADPIQVLADFRALGVSPALVGKLERKLERL